MYTHELIQAIISALMAVPAVRQVNHLQFWGEQNLYIEVDPRTPETVAQVDAALEAVAARWRGLRPARLRWRVIDTGEAMPASAALFTRALAA